MGDPFRKVATGQALDIPAGAYNAFIDAAQAHKQGGIVTPKAQNLRGQLEIILKNTTGDDLRRFDILGVGDPIILPTDNETAFLNRLAFEGEAPDETDHYGKVAILVEPIKAGKLGRALVSGITPVRMVIDDKHTPQATHAMIADGVSTHLLSASSGPIQVLWHEPEGASNWAVVSIGGNTQCVHRGVAHAPAVREDGCAWLSSSPEAYCYVWPWDRVATAPTLSDSTADQFVKVYLPSAGGMAPSVRQDNTIFYTLDQNGDGWAVSPPTDLFLGAIVPTALSAAPPGWVIMNDDATEVYPPNTTLDSLPDALDIDDLRDRMLFGAGERYPDGVFNNDHGPQDENPTNVAPGVFDSYPFPAGLSFANNYWVYGYSVHYLLRVN